MIAIDNLTKSYGKNRVLVDLQARFALGRVHGVVGDNGAGKTTLFRCMAGLETCEGRIEPAPALLRRNLGFLPAEPWYFPKMTGREYVRLLCSARGETARELDQRNVFDLPLDRYASDYSTGMKKKLALLAVLVQDNSLFILDEPFNGVDIQSNMIIMEIIHKLKEAGRTLIVSSHVFATLAETCDEIHLLRNGIVARHVERSGFKSLEEDLRAGSVRHKVDRLQFG